MQLIINSFCTPKTTNLLSYGRLSVSYFQPVSGVKANLADKGVIDALFEEEHFADVGEAGIKAHGERNQSFPALSLAWHCLLSEILGIEKGHSRSAEMPLILDKGSLIRGI